MNKIDEQIELVNELETELLEMREDGANVEALMQKAREIEAAKRINLNQNYQ